MAVWMVGAVHQQVNEHDARQPSRRQRESWRYSGHGLQDNTMPLVCAWLQKQDHAVAVQSTIRPVSLYRAWLKHAIALGVASEDNHLIVVSLALRRKPCHCLQ